MAVGAGFLLVRGVYPRLRYDLLIDLCWKAVLPGAISLLGLLFICTTFCSWEL